MSSQRRRSDPRSRPDAAHQSVCQVHAAAALAKGHLPARTTASGAASTAGRGVEPTLGFLAGGEEPQGDLAASSALGGSSGDATRLAPSYARSRLPIRNPANYMQASAEARQLRLPHKVCVPGPAPSGPTGARRTSAGIRGRADHRDWQIRGAHPHVGGARRSPTGLGILRCVAPRPAAGRMGEEATATFVRIRLPSWTMVQAAAGFRSRVPLSPRFLRPASLGAPRSVSSGAGLDCSALSGHPDPQNRCRAGTARRSTDLPDARPSGPALAVG